MEIVQRNYAVIFPELSIFIAHTTNCSLLLPSLNREHSFDFPINCLLLLGGHISEMRYFINCPLL